MRTNLGKRDFDTEGRSPTRIARRTRRDLSSAAAHWEFYGTSNFPT